jgi:hypothetical protein
VTVSGDDLSGLTVVTGRGATLTGQVVAEGDTAPTFPAGRLRVTGFSPEPGGFGGGNRPAAVKDDWTFELRGVVSPRILDVNGLPQGWRVKAVYYGGQDVTDTPIEPRGGETLEGFRIILTNRLTQVTGAVTDSRGEAAPDYVAVLFSTDSARWGARSRFVQAARPDQQGRYEIQGLPPGDYLAVAVEYLPEGEWRDPAVLEALRSVAANLRLEEGETRGLDLKLMALP